MSDQPGRFGCWTNQKKEGLTSWTGPIQTFIDAYPSDLFFQVIVAFWVGLIFAPWSWGLLYLIIFFVVFELVYAWIHRDFSINNILIRLAVIGASFFGWLVGRVVIEDKHPIRARYGDKYCKMGCKGYQSDASCPQSLKLNQIEESEIENFLFQLDLD